MKLSVRQGVFETNSSSVHACVILPKDEYFRWQSQNLYVVHATNPDNAITSFKVMTYDELKDKFLDDYLRSSWSDDDATKDNFDKDDFEEFSRHYYGAVRYDKFGYGDDYEGYYDEDTLVFTTPSGDVMVMDSYFGYDG